jgi:phospholipid transport system substrate-binding protein
MVFFKILFLALCFLPLDTLKAYENTDSTEVSNLSSYTDFVKEVGDKIVDLFADKSAPLESRKKVFQGILENYFSIKSIGKFVLARYWRQASESERNEYITIFKTALVENYSSHFNEYNNEHLEIIGARVSTDKGVLVQTRIIRPGIREPLLVDWKLFRVENNLKVFDLIVSGASMSISLRTEYSSMIQSNGGTVSGLIQALKKKYNIN